MTAHNVMGPSLSAESIQGSSADPRVSDPGTPPMAAAPETQRMAQPAWPLVLTDLLAVSAATILGLVLLAVVALNPADGFGQIGHNLLAMAVFPLVAVLMLAAYGSYRQRHRRLRNSVFSDLSNLVHAVVVGSLLVLGFSVLLHRLTGTREIRLPALVAVATVALVAVGTARALLWWLRARAPRARSTGATRVLVVGSGMMAERIRNYLVTDSELELVGCVDDSPAPMSPSCIGSIADVSRLCKELGVNRVLIGFSRTHPNEIIEQLRPVQDTVAISIVPRYFELLSWRSQMDEICGLPVIDVAPPQLSRSARVVKRSFDVVGALVGLAVLSPVILVIALTIELSSPGPLLFRQVRAGRGRQPFTIYKFRTMKTGAEDERELLDGLNEVDGPNFKIREDPRVSRVGRFLRRTSLDEIPQLFNVLRGDMSIVGPRPFVPRESEGIDGWAARRFEVRPGLTGLWQISGRNDLSFDELQRLDYVYVASWSLWWDLKILWHTPACVLRSLGAY